MATFKPDVQITGTTDKPLLAGTIEATEAQITAKELAEPVRASELVVNFTPESATTQPFTIETGSTKLAAQATISLATTAIILKWTRRSKPKTRASRNCSGWQAHMQTRFLTSSNRRTAGHRRIVPERSMRMLCSITSTLALSQAACLTLDDDIFMN